jgi:hypothetical protein
MNFNFGIKIPTISTSNSSNQGILGTVNKMISNVNTVISHTKPKVKDDELRSFIQTVAFHNPNQQIFEVTLFTKKYTYYAYEANMVVQALNPANHHQAVLYLVPGIIDPENLINLINSVPDVNTRIKVYNDLRISYGHNLKYNFNGLITSQVTTTTTTTYETKDCIVQITNNNENNMNKNNNQVIINHNTNTNNNSNQQNSGDRYINNWSPSNSNWVYYNNNWGGNNNSSNFNQNSQNNNSNNYNQNENCNSSSNYPDMSKCNISTNNNVIITQTHQNNNNNNNMNMNNNMNINNNMNQNSSGNNWGNNNNMNMNNNFNNNNWK